MRRATICVMMLGFAPMLCAQAPTVSLSLPRGIDPAKAQLLYFLSGTFGGSGQFVRTERDRFEYQIKASSEGQPADRVSIVTYAPGCEFSAFRIDLHKEPAAWRQVECVPLPTITLHGQISPAVTANPSPELIVLYDADWINSFFGIMDGMVHGWEVARTTPDAEGHFSVELPNFCLQAGVGFALGQTDSDSAPFCEAGRLEFFLQNPKTHERFANLSAHGEKIGIVPLPEYPDVLQFKFVPLPDRGLTPRSD